MNAQPQELEAGVVDQFLNDSGWGSAQVVPMGADMGLRRYARLIDGDRKALFMDMSRAGILETGLGAYVTIGTFLQKHGVRTPEIYAHDLETGLSIIEDMGSVSFGDARKQGVPDNEIYQKATDVLVGIKNSASENVLNLNGYEDTLIRKRLGQFVDYYMPIGADRLTTQADHDAFQSVMKEIEATLPSCPMGICHADYHLENLMWNSELPDGYGLIDFQDAFWGFSGYDLLNLLEDARQTVPDDIKSEMKERYCAGMSAEERETFDAWYAYLSAHFHCRVIGLFIKFAKENGGVEFLAHIPRLQNYIKTNLQNPVLKPLKDFIETNRISFDCQVS